MCIIQGLIFNCSYSLSNTKLFLMSTSYIDLKLVQMAKQSLNLMEKMSKEIIQHFVRTRQGITYEALATAVEAHMQVMSAQLDYIGQRDIDNNELPLDALVVNKSNGIPSPEHFLLGSNRQHHNWWGLDNYCRQRQHKQPI